MASNDLSAPAVSQVQQVSSNRDAWAIRLSVITFVLLILFGGPIEQLLFGWLYFLLRVTPRITVDWPTAVLGIVCAIAFVITLHATVQWFRAATNSPNTVPITWRWQSTGVVATILLLMFAAGTAMVGATHQFIWLMSSRVSTEADKAARAQLRVPALIYAVEQARESARRTQTRNVLKMLGLAMHGVAEVDHSLPPGGVVLSDGTPLHGWAIRLSGHTSFYVRDIDWSSAWNQPPNDVLYKCQVFDFLNPSLSGSLYDDDGYGLGHYAGNVHVLPIRTINVSEIPDSSSQGMAMYIRRSSPGLKLEDITDGTSNTIMVGTVAERLKAWGDPTNVRDPALGINRSPDGFGGPAQWHGGMFLMCDGSVRFFDEKIDPKVMRALGTPASGDSIPPEYLSDR